MGAQYEVAKRMYQDIGVDTEAALDRMEAIPVSVHCWQIDDLSGFESPDRGLSGGIAALGNAAGKPRTQREFFANLSKALSLIPGKNKVAIHAIYHNAGKAVDRDAIEPKHFSDWVEYAKEKKVGLDFNPTYFSHDKAADNLTLSSPDQSIRQFWVEHGKRCRKIGEYFGKELGQTCITNHWIPDGCKDYTIDKLAPRLRLVQSMDEILAEPMDPKLNIDSFESKLFGLGLESYTVGSHEFYSNYCAHHNNCIVCMDTGHFHPTETVSSKLASYLAFDQEIMLHVSRPVRWDSDHVVALDDEVKELMLEIKRQNAFDRVHIGSDYFDASIDRVRATVIGARNIKKALLYALLEPSDVLMEIERNGDFTKRLALVEELKTMPFGLVWDEFCRRNGMPAREWVDKIL